MRYRKRREKGNGQRKRRRKGQMAINHIDCGMRIGTKDRILNHEEHEEI
jgi:hypothetical protein